MYQIKVTPAAQRDLTALPKSVFKRVDAKIRSLAEDPHPRGAKKLEDTLFRVRVGDYRIIYQVVSDTITIVIVRVRHRREVYRGL
ncbi:MAG: type II toxin-antitoxin system RelE family toxin [Pyrinomonadaceae bacterium]